MQPVTPNVGFLDKLGDGEAQDQVFQALVKLLDGSILGQFATRLTEVPSASLNVYVSPGSWVTAAGTWSNWSGGTVAIGANTTQHLTLLDAGYVYAGSGWVAGIRLAVVVAGSSSILSITDGRSPWHTY